MTVLHRKCEFRLIFLVAWIFWFFCFALAILLAVFVALELCAIVILRILHKIGMCAIFFPYGLCRDVHIFWYFRIQLIGIPKFHGYSEKGSPFFNPFSWIFAESLCVCYWNYFVQIKKIQTKCLTLWEKRSFIFLFFEKWIWINAVHAAVVVGNFFSFEAFKFRLGQHQHHRRCDTIRYYLEYIHC